MTHFLLLTCEHGGNQVPKEYIYLFQGNEEVLYSHKAIDLGALRLAKHLAHEFGLKLHYTTIARLLVEANRSPQSEELFSEFVKDQPLHVKQSIMEKYYLPHRRKVEEEVKVAIEKGLQVIHVALHSFAPVEGDNVRKTAVGILFDPKRSKEMAFAQSLKTELLAINPSREVDINSPYEGTQDCLARYLREHFPPEAYLGFEIEINQKFFLDGEPEVWDAIVREFTTGLATVHRNWTS